MSYTYVLLKLNEKTVRSGHVRFKDATKENIVDWGYTMEEVQQHLARLYPTAEWENIVNTLDGTEHQQISGEVFDMPGRFDFMIAEYPVPALFIGGSYRVNQVPEIAKIAAVLRLSVFDVQIGECIYLQPLE